MVIEGENQTPQHGGKVESLEVKLTQLTELVKHLATIQVQSSTNAIPATSFQFTSYSPDSLESVDEYFARFQLQLKLHNVPETNWAAHLRVCMGPELNSVLNTISYPTAIETLDATAIMSKLLAHYAKSHNKFSEAINFRKILQRQGEKVIEFVTRLKLGAKYCKFDTFLDYSLTVQLIHGIIRDDIRDAIVSDEPATFQEAVDIATKMEATRAAVKMLKPCQPDNVSLLHDSRPRLKSYNSKRNHHRRSSSNRESSASSHGSTSSRRSSASPKRSGNRYFSPSLKSSNPKPRNPCNSCGAAHWRKDCKYRNSECHNCGIKGHLAVVCRKTQRRSSINEISEHNYVQDETLFFHDKVEQIQSNESSPLPPM